MFDLFSNNKKQSEQDLDAKIERQEKELAVFGEQLRLRDLEKKELLDKHGLTMNDIKDFFYNKENFSEELWEYLQQKRQTLKKRVEDESEENKHGTKKRDATYSDLKEISELHKQTSCFKL